MATIQYHVVQILLFLYLLIIDSYIVAINGGRANCKYPKDSDSTRLEKYAMTMILNPVVSAI